MGSPTTDVLTQRLADQIAGAQQSSKPNVILAGNLRRIAQGQPGPKSFITACSSLGRLGLSDEFLESVYSQVSTDKSNGTPSNVRLQDSGRASEVRREEAEAAAALAEAPGGLFIPKREPGGRRNNGARQEQSPVDRNSAGSQSRSPKRIKLEHVNGGDGGQLSGRSSMPPPPRPVSPAPAPSREEHRSSSPRIKREPAEGKPIPYFKREIHSRSSTPHSRSKIESRDFPDPASREEQLAQDREWYTSDETGPVLGDDTGNPFDGFDDFGVKYKADGRSVQNKFRYSDQKLMQRKRDDDAWETNRMLTSGVAQRRDFGGREADDDDQNETRIHLLVHDVKPPFLEKHRIYTKQLEPVSAVRDPQSDLAVLSRKGSVVVRERRQQRERTRQAQAATTAAGSTLGNIMGVEEEDSTQPEATNTSGSGKNRFSEHMGSTGNATALEISQAVQNLPVFAVQEEFLEIVAENQVLIVVGETGKLQSMLNPNVELGRADDLSHRKWKDDSTRPNAIPCRLHFPRRRHRLHPAPTSRRSLGRQTRRRRDGYQTRGPGRLLDPVRERDECRDGDPICQRGCAAARVPDRFRAQ